MGATLKNGLLHWNDVYKRWEDDEGNMGYYHKKICPKCNKPCLDINNINNVDFCLQGLSSSEFIDNACCGHGDDSQAYISLKDGRRFILDKEWSAR